MKYWAYINDQVLGPVEIGKLPGLANFVLSSLICPETPAGEQTAGWKEASAYPEVLAVLAPAPVPARPARPDFESPLAMTMRGTLIEEPAYAAPQPAESPLAMTMRGTLIEQPVIIEPAGGAPEKAPTPVAPEVPGAAPASPAGREPAPQADPTRQKLDQISAMMVSIANGQSQLLDRLGRLEGEVADMKAQLPPPPPGK
jgi:hypothetical protein